MATEVEMRKLAAKAIEDESFRAAFEADPKKAATSLGITLTAEQLAELKEKKAEAEAAEAREAKAWFVSWGGVVVG